MFARPPAAATRESVAVGSAAGSPSPAREQDTDVAIAVTPPWLPLDVDKTLGRETIRVFRCVTCRRWRVRGRWDEGGDGTCVGCESPMNVDSY